jgi:hypothetical protein
MPALDPIYSQAVAIFFAFVFAFAGHHKVMDYSRHVGIVADYQLVPASFVPVAAPLVIILEFASAALVLLAVTRAAGLVLSVGLLVIYLFSIGLNLLRGRRSIDCGCGWGSQGHQLSAWLIFRNLLMIGAALAALLPLIDRSLQLADWILVIFTASALIAIYFIGDLLIANGSRLSKLKSVYE